VKWRNKNTANVFRKSVLKRWSLNLLIRLFRNGFRNGKLFDYKNSVSSTRNIHKVQMALEIWELFQKVPLFWKLTNKEKLYTKLLSQGQIHKSHPVFTSVIFLAIFSDINAADAKVMHKASNKLYFLPLILVKCVDEKKWIVFEKQIHS